MKRMLVVCILSIISIALFAQGNTDSSGSISNVPTARELVLLFSKTASGQFDPFIVIPKVTTKQVNSVPALQAILASQPTDSIWIIGYDSTVVPPTPKYIDAQTRSNSLLYSVMALQVIGTQKAFTVLFNVAGTHPDAEVRGKALSVLANDYYQAVLNNKISPSVSVLRLFVLQADDTTQTNCLGKSIAVIARDGIKNWLGQDWGDPITPEQQVMIDSVVSATGGQKMPNTTKVTMAQLHSQWWKNNQNKLLWNQKTGTFEVK